MNIRTLAFSAIAIAVIGPAAIATPATAVSDVHHCIFQPASDRDGLNCNPFTPGSDTSLESHGLEVASDRQWTLEKFTIQDTRGSSKGDRQ